MRIDTQSARLPLPAGQIASLQMTPRMRVRGLAGHAWLTLDNDTRDIVLGPGDEFVADAGGRAREREQPRRGLEGGQQIERRQPRRIAISHA